MTAAAIQVEGLSKLYRLDHRNAPHDSFRSAITAMALAPLKRFRQLQGSDDTMEEFWALRDVSFEVQPGEVVGVIGRNGAGKSTLLKILSRIVEPTRGRAVMRGRIASLLEVGTGFHPELSGRENIYLNGAILGMRRREIDAAFDDIVAFAEVEKFLDTPVKRYSSGMYVRLAFAVAAHLEPEILIVDEVLAVGDAEFQKKCLGKMRQVASGSGKTVLFVSHNMLAVRSLCTRGIFLSAGSIEVAGTADEAISAYVNMAAGTNHTTAWTRPASTRPPPSLTIESVRIEVLGMQPRHVLRCQAHLKTRCEFPGAIVAIDVHDPLGAWLMQAVPRTEPFIFSTKESHDLSVDVELPPLIPGTYVVSVWAGIGLTHTIDWAREVVAFDILDSPTPGRTIPHSADRGFCVPVSTVSLDGSA
jgi:lipopolysaccharide transport system ATP-binding protein